MKFERLTDFRKLSDLEMQRLLVMGLRAEGKLNKKLKEQYDEEIRVLDLTIATGISTVRGMERLMLTNAPLFEVKKASRKDPLA